MPQHYVSIKIGRLTITQMGLNSLDFKHKGLTVLIRHTKYTQWSISEGYTTQAVLFAEERGKKSMKESRW